MQIQTHTAPAAHLTTTTTGGEKRKGEGKAEKEEEKDDRGRTRHSTSALQRAVTGPEGGNSKNGNGQGRSDTRVIL